MNEKVKANDRWSFAFTFSFIIYYYYFTLFFIHFLLTFQ